MLRGRSLGVFEIAGICPRRRLRSSARATIAALATLALIAADCGAAPPEAVAPTATPAPTSVVAAAPTEAPAPTPEPSPTPTSKPVLTATSAPTPTAQTSPTAQPTPTPTLQPTPTPSLEADFGDAPDGTDAGYPGVAVRAQFPSLLASDGARILKPGLDVLGIQISAEAEANTVNQDGGDDGAVGLAMALGSLPARAQLFADVSIAADAPAGPRYLNALIDLDRDGRWSSSGGGLDEWVVRNQAVDAAPGDTILVESDPFPFAAAGGIPDGAWMRVLLTREPLEGDAWDGRGAWEFGEVEDYQLAMPPVPAPVLDCPGGVSLIGTFLRTFECTVTNLGADGAVRLSFTREEFEGVRAAPPCAISPLGSPERSPVCVAPTTQVGALVALRGAVGSPARDGH